MSTVEVDLLIIVYGSCSRDPDTDERFSGYEQRRVEISLKPKIPLSATVSMQAKHEWMNFFLLGIGLDVKHSRNWRCEFCTKKARETVWMMASWMHLSPPKLNCYVHNICDGAHGKCYEKLSNCNQELGAMVGHPPNPLPRSSRPAGKTEYPLSASCACCEREETAQKHQLKQCMSCKVTRYCSAECQRPDWPRHKQFCKAVKDVKWVWN
ncbi:hypothetical protein C8J56DRAFT_963519 [Mycena floridula]|nr:hypothetical protein C8J56DRAFT_963519 [Mycena floridula]